jgi:hypothetical protein
MTVRTFYTNAGDWKRLVDWAAELRAVQGRGDGTDPGGWWDNRQAAPTQRCASTQGRRRGAPARYPGPGVGSRPRVVSGLKVPAPSLAGSGHRTGSAGPSGRLLIPVRDTALLCLLGKQQCWAWMPLPMVLAPGVAAPAELVGLVPGASAGPTGSPVGGSRPARARTTHIHHLGSADPSGAPRRALPTPAGGRSPSGLRAVADSSKLTP